MRAIRRHAILAFVLVLSACAGRAGPAVAPQVQAPAPGVDAGAPPPTGAAPQPSSSGGSVDVLPVAPISSPPRPVVEMKQPIPTNFASDLAALGLDAKKLPPFDKLDPKALRGVMKLMARSLGLKCTDCHVEGDFAAPTSRKRIAVHMWNEFAAKLEMDGGAPLFCDSCHQGRTALLDHRDKKALGAWMNENLVVMLQRKDGQPHDCETCHVGMEMKLVSKWAAP